MGPELRQGALTGLKVLDLTQGLSGPFCTLLLADHGAEVTKLEPPVSGDIARGAGPFHPEDPEHLQAGYFHSINRNKRSIVIDLKKPEGRDIFLRLLPGFDVLVENFRVGVMDELGLSYETLHAQHPSLVYGAVRGFGDPRSGASDYATWPAFDVVAQAMGGFVAVTGPAEDQVVKAGPGVGDTVPGLYLAFGILAAVLHARATGRGQFVDVGMVDAILGVSERSVHQKSFGKIIAKPEGNHHPLMSPFGIFPARDGHVAIAATAQRFFNILCTELDAQHLMDDPDFAEPPLRARNRHRLNDLMSEVTRKFTKQEMTARLGGKVPFGPVYDIADIFEDPHFAVREMLQKIRVPGISEELEIAGVPIKMSETPGAVRTCGPQHGEHTDQILGDAGFTRQEIARWKTDGVIFGSGGDVRPVGDG